MEMLKILEVPISISDDRASYNQYRLRFQAEAERSSKPL